MLDVSSFSVCRAHYRLESEGKGSKVLHSGHVLDLGGTTQAVLDRGLHLHDVEETRCQGVERNPLQDTLLDGRSHLLLGGATRMDSLESEQ